MECFISEIYACHLGEGLAVGEPATLVRFAGCNLNCTYCDTRFACEESGAALSVPAVVERCQTLGHASVLITGGEPLLQADACLELVTRLRASGLRVLVETNGSQPVAALAGKAELVLDVKTPGSGEGESFLRANLASLCPEDQLKFVLLSRADYDWAKGFLCDCEPALAPGNILFSAAAGDLSPQDLSRWMLEDRLPYRFHIQAHKAVWGDARGV
jgi:7-carboxy-7-deazaguanine synthase